MTLTQIIEKTVKDLKAGFKIDFLAGTKDELNIDFNVVEMLILLTKPYISTIDTIGGGRIKTSNIEMLFTKTDALANSDINREITVESCELIYEQFIQRLKTTPLLRITSESYTQIYDDSDMNLTGIRANLTIVQNLTASTCLL